MKKNLVMEINGRVISKVIIYTDGSVSEVAEFNFSHIPSVPSSFVLKHATCQELPNSKISATLQDALSRAAH